MNGNDSDEGQVEDAGATVAFARRQLVVLEIMALSRLTRGNLREELVGHLVDAEAVVAIGLCHWDLDGFASVENGHAVYEGLEFENHG